MGIEWRNAPEMPARLLREHDQDPAHVTNVEAAW